MTIQSGSQTIAASDTAIDLHGTFKNIQIWTDTGSADISIQLNNGAAVAGADDTIKIAAGRAAGFVSNGQMAISGFHYIGASAAGRINWVATP